MAACATSPSLSTACAATATSPPPCAATPATKQGTAVASAEIFGCRDVSCGSETDREVIELRR
jgi:hypothetical protein